MTSKWFVIWSVSCALVLGHGRQACHSNLTCDNSELLQRKISHTERKMSDFERHGTWAYPQDWRTSRDLANVTEFPPIVWGTVDETDVVLSFFSAVPVFGPDGNYIALLHLIDNRAPLQYLIETGKLALFCSGPQGSHRTEVRILGNETTAAYKIHLVFVCDWPEDDKHLERFEVSLENGDGKYLGTIVAEQKNGLLQQYHTVACVRDVYPSETAGLRLLPTWLEFHRLHGIDHFIIYTVNVDSEVLVDAYEPYVASGVASRVHFHHKAIGNHGPDQSMQRCDCLYRAKNHATWLLATLDIDEFFNMKDGSFFDGGVVPKDYLSSSWDAIVKAQGFHRDQVHSINFQVYRFAPAEADQVELRSVMRDPGLQHTNGKFVLNVAATKTLFIHWVISAKNGTRSLSIDEDIGVIHHYREAFDFYNLTNPLSQKDTSMLQYVPELERSMEERFHIHDVAPFLRQMSAATE